MKYGASELQVLLACLRYYFGTVTATEVVALVRSVVDWEEIVRLAIDRGVMPLLYQALKQLDAECVPRAILLQLQALHRMNGLKNIAHTKELLNVMARLELAGIETIAFKGVALAAACYGNVALRQFNDLDLLVRQQDFWRAKEILLELGYRSTCLAAAEQEMYHRHLQISLAQSDADTKMLNQRFADSPLHCNPEHSIDLHWGIPPRQIANPARVELIWQNPHKIELMGRSIATFSPEVALVTQCLNVAKDALDRPIKPICDIAQVVKAYPQLDWHLAVAIASQLRCQRLFEIGLGLMHDLLDVPLPKFIIATLDRTPVRNERSDRDLIPVIIIRKLYPFTTLDRSWEMIFTIGFQLQFLLTNLLSPNELDRQFIPLPPRLSWLYYFVRPIRLLLTYIPWRKLTIETSEL
jgi:hypothetical protein